MKKPIGALLILVAAFPVACAGETCGPLFTVERNVNANVVVTRRGGHAEVTSFFMNAIRPQAP